MIKATVNTQRNKIIANNNQCVILYDNINNAKFYNVSTKEDLPIEGQPKTFYYIDKESALYIYCNNDYLKINNDLLDSLNELELISNENKDNISQLIKDLEELRQQNDSYKREMSYKIETITGSTEDIQRNFNEYILSTSNLYNNFQKELDEASKTIESFDQKFENIDSTIEDVINDSQITQDEVLILLSQKQKLESDFKQLSKEYEDIDEYISNNKYITNSKGEKIYFKDIIENELDINFDDLTLQWSTNNLDEDILNQYFQSNVVPSVNNLSEQYGIKELYEILIKLLNTFDTPRKLASIEKTIWYNVSDALNIDLAELQYSFRQILEKATSFDAQDALMETIASINSSMNGLQDQIDGQITNWNGDQMPSPIYDHITQKYYKGLDENGNEIWDYKKPDPNYPVTDWIIYNEDGTTDATKTNNEYNKHINDTYVDLKTGKAYRWCLFNRLYHWCKITDTATEQALSQAAKTQQALDGRITTYTTKPTSYEVGDLFITDNTYGSFKKGEILNCITSSTGTFDISHWSRECSYTDDSRAEEAEDNAKDYSDKNIENNNKKQLINVNNLILYNKAPWEFSSTSTKQQLHLSEPLIPGKTYTFGYKGNFQMGLICGVVTAIDGSQSSPGNLITTIYNNFTKEYKYNEITNTTTYTFTVEYRDDPDAETIPGYINTLFLYCNPDRTKEQLNEPFLYRGSVDTDLWKPASPVIDVNLLGQILYKIMVNWNNDDVGFKENDIKKICFNLFEQY